MVAGSKAAGGFTDASHGALLALLREVIHQILGDEEFSNDIPLMEAGMDSLATIEFRNTLQSRLEIKLPSVLIFDHPTASSVAALAGDLLLADS